MEERAASSAAPTWLTPSPAVLLDGAERFVGLDATVADFWRWAFSDLRDNTTRGILAEFLVAKAVGDQRTLRIGWDNFDAQAPDGTTIEVKCSAFLQSWVQKRYSDLVFGALPGSQVYGRSLVFCGVSVQSARPRSGSVPCRHGDRMRRREVRHGGVGVG